MIVPRSVLLVSLLASPLVACGDGKGGSSDGTTGGDTTGDEPPATTSPITTTDFGTTASESETSAGTTEAVTTTAPTSTDPTTTDVTTTDATTTSDATTTTTGEDSEGSDTGSGAVDYIADIQPIWDMRCVVGCHVEGGAAQVDGPILTAQKSYGELVDAPSPNVPGIVRVAPGSLDDSYLWHKLEGTHADVGGVGSQMPLGGMLTAKQRTTIEAWILAGAAP